MHLPPINFDSVTGALFSKLKNVFSTLHQQDTHIVLAGIAFSANFMTKVLKKSFSPHVFAISFGHATRNEYFCRVLHAAHARRRIIRVDIVLFTDSYFPI